MIKRKDFLSFFPVLTPIILVIIGFGCVSSNPRDQFRGFKPLADVSPNVQTQTGTLLSDEDKEQIIVEILRQENLKLKNTGKWKKDSQNIIYIQRPLPVKKIPQIDGVEVKFMPSFVETKKQSEVSFYEFKDFQVKDSKVKITVIWKHRDSTSINQNIFEYECEKLSNKWEVKAKSVGVSVGH